MTTINRTLTVGRMFMLTLILALGIAAGTQTAAAGTQTAACTDTAERYPMLIGSGYEGEPCGSTDPRCAETVARYPMLIGSGYEGQPCGLSSTDHALTTSAKVTTSKTDQAVLDCSDHERAVVDVAPSGNDHD